MVKVRLGALLSGTRPMNKTGANAVQIYGAGGMTWSKKPVIMRNAPYTIEHPHLGQAETRIHFGEIAQRHKGETGLIEGLPAVAWHIQNDMKHYHAEDAMPKDMYPSKESFHTIDELRSYVEETKGEGRREVYAPTPSQSAAAGLRRMTARRL